MKIKFKDHIVIQNLFNSELALVNPEISLTTYWMAKGFAGDVVRLIQRRISKDDLILELGQSYRGSSEMIEKNLDEVLEALNQEKMLFRPSKTKSPRVARTGLKSLVPKPKSKKSSEVKKKIEWSFERTVIAGSEVLPAYAVCFSDADCAPGQTCVIGADWCLNFCTTT